MQLISVLTALATFKVAGAAALPSAVIGAKDLVTRDDHPFGTKVCVDVNFGGYCQTFSSAEVLKSGKCVRLDDSIRGFVSSVQPLEKSICRYSAAENCGDPTSKGCDLYDAFFPGIADLKTVVPDPFSPNTKKCEPVSMDKRIRSFFCTRHLT